MNPDLAHEEINSFAEINFGKLMEAYNEFSDDHLFVRIAAINRVLWVRSKTNEK